MTLFFLLFLIIGAVSAADDASLEGDVTGHPIAQAADNISNDNNLKSENDDFQLGDSGTTTVNNWVELKSATNDGAVIELDGGDVYYAEGSSISIDSGTVTIDGRGHTIDAMRLNSRIFVVNDGATLVLKNLILKNAKNVGDGGAIYNEGTLTVAGCTFTNNTATSEKGGAIYNHEGTLKISHSIFEKNEKYDRAIYNYGTEDDPFRLTIINATMIEDKVTVNYKDNERRLDDKRDIDLLTTEFNVDIPKMSYEGVPVLIDVAGVDTDFTGKVTVNITNTIYNTEINIVDGKGNTTMSFGINGYTARFKNFISLTEEAFDVASTKPYLEINFNVAIDKSLKALNDMISKATDNISLSHDYVFSQTDSNPGIKISGRSLTIYGNGHSINGNGACGLFFIESDSDVTMVNITLENSRGSSVSHWTSQVVAGGAIYVKENANLTVINSTFKNNEANNLGGAIYMGPQSNLNITGCEFIDNNAPRGKNIFASDAYEVYIFKSNIDENDVGSEVGDFDLPRITIINEPNAVLDISSHVMGDDTIFEVVKPENFNADANLTINGIPQGSIKIENGRASANLNLAPGAYTATISTPEMIYCEDASRNLTCTYLAANTTSNEFIVYRVVDIQLSVQNITYGETETVTAYIDGQGNVTIILDGRTIKKELAITGNTVKYEIPENITAGNHTVEVVYNGNRFALNNSRSAEFRVNRTYSSLSAGDVVSDYGKPISVDVKAEGAVNITAKIDGVKVDVDGFEVSVPVLDAGTYNLTIAAVPDANHISVNRTVRLTVNSVDAKLNFSGVELDYGKTSSLDVAVEGAVAITAKIDGVNVAVDGFRVPIPVLDVGSHNLTVYVVSDANHNAVNKTVTIKVGSVDAMLNFNGVELDHGKTSSLDVAVEGAVAITAKIDGVNVAVDGFKVIIPVLNAGSHNLTVYVVSDANHNPVDKTVTLTVNKVDSTLKLNDISFVYGGEGSASVSFTGAENITAEVVNHKYAVVTVNDSAITVSALNAGDYDLKVTTVPDENHNPVTRTASIKVSKAPSEVKIDVNANHKVGDSFDILIANSTDAFVTINNEIYSIVKGKVDINTTTLKAGTYKVTARIAESANFKESSDDATFIISKLSAPQILIDADVSVVEGSDLVVSISVGDATGIASINGVNVTLSNGKASTSIKNVRPGNLTIDVAYFGDDRYMDSSASSKVNVYSKKDAGMNAFAKNIELGETAVVSITINPDVTGKITVDGKEVSISNGRLDYAISNLKSGNHSVVVRFEGDRYFSADEITVSFEVVKSDDIGDIEPEIIVPSFEKPSDNGTVTVELPSDATGTVTLTVDNESYTFDVIDGKADVVLPNLDEGDYNYTITYSGDAKYSKFSKSESMNVLKEAVSIDSSSLESPITEETVVVNLPSDATGTVTIGVEGQNYTFTVENGKVDVKIPELTNGDYNYTISYSGDWKYSKFTKEGNLTVNKTTKPAVDLSSLSASNVKVTYAAGSYYTIRVCGADGKLANGVEVVISGKISKKLTTKNGVASFKVTNVPGTYKITIKALGKSVTRTLTVKHLLSLKSAALKKSAKKLTLQAALAKVNGKYLKNKKIVFKINGKKVAVAKTNKKGIAKITIKNPSVVKKLKVGKKVVYEAIFLKDAVKKTTKIRK